LAGKIQLQAGSQGTEISVADPEYKEHKCAIKAKAQNLNTKNLSYLIIIDDFHPYK
jgi:hypothetical protein